MVSSTKGYDYDAALSYAEEDQSYVNALASSLTKRGIRFFDDKDEKPALWGKNLYTYLAALHQSKARYCVMFLSQNYAAKLRTNQEREIAQARAFKEQEEYILPIRIDYTDIPGILPTTVCLDWSQETPETIADKLLVKLNREISPLSFVSQIPVSIHRDERSPILHLQGSSTAQIDISGQSHKSKEQWLNEGNDFYRRGDYRKALVAYDQSIQLDPSNSTAHNNKGNAHYYCGQSKRALKSYEQAIRLAPNNVSAYCNMGKVLSYLGYYDEAFVAYDHASQLASNNASAYCGKGEALYQLGKYDAALTAYNRVIKINPNDTSAYYGKGKALYQLGKYDAALTAYNRAIKINPNDASAYYGKGNTCRALSRYEEARSAFEHSI
ncbi:MAG: tetratricopeptide repeat protein, partial [Ktedonobacteraceae bacterium]